MTGRSHLGQPIHALGRLEVVVKVKPRSANPLGTLSPEGALAFGLLAAGLDLGTCIHHRAGDAYADQGGRHLADEISWSIAPRG